MRETSWLLKCRTHNKHYKHCKDLPYFLARKSGKYSSSRDSLASGFKTKLYL